MYIWKQGHFEFQLSKTIDWASSGTMWKPAQALFQEEAPVSPGMVVRA